MTGGMSEVKLNFTLMRKIFMTLPTAILYHKPYVYLYININA